MSPDRKNVKLISFLAFAVAVAQLVLVVAGIATHGDAPWETRDIVSLVANGVSSIVYLFGCVYGIRGANRPSAIDPLPIICIVGMLQGAAWTATGAMGLGGLGTNQLSCIISGAVEVAFFFAWRSIAVRVIEARDNRI